MAMVREAVQHFLSTLHDFTSEGRKE
jgi:hypothetical protein